MGGDVEVCKKEVCKKGDDLWRSNMRMTVGSVGDSVLFKKQILWVIDANSGYLAIANHQNQKCHQTEEA